MLKSFFLLLISVVLFSCNYPGEGSLGGWSYITFPVQKDKFKVAIDSFRNANPENEIPEKWQYDSQYWKRNSAGIIESELLYVKKEPEEMYFISYIPNDDDKNGKSTTIIALRSVFRNGTWHRKSKLDTTEQKRISKRFYQEIIAPLELITNTRSIAENEKYEQPANTSPGNKSTFELIIESDKDTGKKKQLNIKEKTDSIAATLLHGKFNISAVHLLEKICAKSNDSIMESFSTTVEELFYSHMVDFTNYYMANPGSCLEGKLKLSMEEYMSVYEPKDRKKKHTEKENRILKKAKREHFSSKQLDYLHTLFNSINLQ